MPLTCSATLCTLSPVAFLSPRTKASAQTRPPRLCATRMMGRSFYGQQVVRFRDIFRWECGIYTIWRASLGTKQSAEASCIALQASLCDLRNVRMYNVGVVTKAHDSTILDIGCEEVSWPKVSIFHPGLLSMAPQAVNEDNTKFRGSQQSVATSLGGWTHSTSGLSAVCNVDRPYFDIFR